MRISTGIIVIVVPLVALFVHAKPMELDEVITNAIPIMNLTNPAAHNNVSINYVNIQSAQQVGGQVDRGSYVSNIFYSIFQIPIQALLAVNRMVQGILEGRIFG